MTALRQSIAPVVLLLALLPSGAAAQWETDPAREFQLVAVNALLGGAGAGLVAWVRGDPPLPAFVQGAGGGALAYAGKRIALGGGAVNGIVGRQVASVGSSVVGNAVAGRGPLDRVAFSLWPVRLYVGRDVDGVDWRIDAVAAGALAWGLLQGWSIDTGQSLSSGAVVFAARSEMALPGTIYYHTDKEADRQAYVLAHERVHVLQYDQSFLSFGGPAEAWLATRSPTFGAIARRFELNLVNLAAVGIGFGVWSEHHRQPWEQEAIYLARSRSGGSGVKDGFWRGWPVVIGAAVALAMEPSAEERSLEAAVAEAARELAPLHPFAEPELLVVDSAAAAHLDAPALARSLALPLGTVTVDCPTEDSRDCVVEPPVAAYLRVEDYDLDRDPGGRLVVTLGYYSLPPPFGENNYMLAHELFLERTAAGWRVVEMREVSEG